MVWPRDQTNRGGRRATGDRNPLVGGRDRSHRSGSVSGAGETAGDRGSATAWVVGAIAAMLVVTAAGVQLGAAAVTRHRATAAADLAALGAAVDAVFGRDRACARAGWVAERMGGRVVSCHLAGWDALVEVTARPPEPLAAFGVASARARAGPVQPLTGP